MTSTRPGAVQDASRPSSPEGPTGQLCVWAAGVADADIPAAIRARTRDLVLDGIGCALLGAQLPWSRVAVEALTSLEGEGDVPLIGWGRGMRAGAAAVLNSSFIQGFELDDFHPLAPLHSASLLLPALFAASARRGGARGRDFLTAFVTGCEVGPRVGLALHGSEMLSRGWHSGPVFGTHAAAAAVGRLLGLSAGQFEDALGLAATQSGGLMAAQFESMGKRMQHGFAARAGLSAAFLAAGGYTGIKRVYERDYGGFLSVFGEGHDPQPAAICEGLGQDWETARIAIKPYAAMGALHAPLDALFEIATARGLRAEDIAAIDVYLSHAAFHHGWWRAERPLTPTAAQMNVAYALAAAVLDGAELARQFAPARINADDIWALMPRITAHHEPAFDLAGAAGRGRTRLVVRFYDGSVAEAEVLAPKAILSPPDAAYVERKFCALTAELLTEERQQAILRMVRGLDELEDIAPLIDLLAAPVGSLFEEE